MGESCEADPRAHPAGGVEKAVVEFQTGGEAAVETYFRWRACGGGLSDDGIFLCFGEVGRDDAGIWSEIVETADAEESAVGVAETFEGVLAYVVGEKGEDGTAGGKGGGGDGGQFEEGGWG